MNPPDICGYCAVFAGLARDPRWLAVRDKMIDPATPDLPGSIGEIDAWVNSNVEYTTDRNDEWNEPMSTLASRSGDCEDIALLKRALILASGKPEDEVVFLIAFDLIARRDHAMILMLDGNEWKALDSANSLSLPVSRISDYRPVIAFCIDQSWVYGRRSSRTNTI